VDDHAKAVDIGNLQARQLGTPYPCAIERHQYHAMKPSLGAVDEVGKSFWAQYAGKESRPLRIRCIGHAPGFLDRLRVGEPQSREPLRHRGRGQLSLAERIRLVGTGGSLLASRHAVNRMVRRLSRIGRVIRGERRRRPRIAIQIPS
jgi:hypothetical protein